MTDPIEKLAEIFPNLQNGQKLAIKDVKADILEMQSHIADLESTLSRQPLPEAPASITVKVVDPATQFEYLVTVRDAWIALKLIERIPDISAALTGLGLVAFLDSRRPAIAPVADAHPAGDTPVCPEHGGPMKQGRKGWYCPKIVTEVQGKKIYCNHTA